MPSDADAKKREEIVCRIERLLAIPYEETLRVLKNTLQSENPQDGLIDLLGYDFIEDIFFILENPGLFTAAEREAVNDEGLYIEHVIEPDTPLKVDAKKRISTSVLGADSRYFPYEYFNTLQSAVFSAVWESAGNVLVAAPTGAGKTDVALIGIVKALSSQRRKGIYIAPMKALAGEIVTKFCERLGSDFKVVEFTGDTKGEVIDEIHLLGEKRGAVLEALVQRFRSISERTQVNTRFIGLSATLPNYKDVAEFLDAPHVFHFDQRYRPVPLRTTLVGFRKEAKRKCWEKYLLEFLRKMVQKEKQTLVFVSSRSRTAKLAKWIIEEKILPANDKINSTDQLSFFISHSIGIHHAGMSRDERRRVEESFRENKLQILVCTTTLAWGVNLPAHAVVIFGTSFYNQGAVNQLSILDVVQIFGRAGRPQYDTDGGTALLITEAVHVPGYLQQLSESKDIESSLLYALPDVISAEIYLRNISSFEDAVRWISGTFLYTRMSKNPALYGIFLSSKSSDSSIDSALCDYVNLTLQRLQTTGMIYLSDNEETKGNKPPALLPRFKSISSTPLGRIAAVYYVSHYTIYNWIKELSVPGTFNERTVISILISSHEFSEMAARPEESPALQKAAEQLILRRLFDQEFDGTLESKLTVLLYSHIAFMKLPVFTLQSDLTFILDTLDRLVPAFKEVLVLMKLFLPFRITAELYRKIERSRWYSKDLENLVPKVQATRVVEFIDLSVEWPKSTYNRSYRHSPTTTTSASRPLAPHVIRTSAILYQDGEAIYCTMTESFFREMLKARGNLEIEIFCGGFVWRFPLVAKEDYSPNALLKYGIHSCDTVVKVTKSGSACPHFTINSESGTKASCGTKKETYGNSYLFNFSLSIDLVVIDGGDFKEQSKHIDHLVSEIPSHPPFLYICSSKDDAYEAASLLTTLRALRQCYDGVEVWEQHSSNSSTSRAVAFSDAHKAAASYDKVIFRSCRSKNSFYFITKLLALLNRKEATIYERQEFIEYFKEVLN